MSKIKKTCTASINVYLLHIQSCLYYSHLSFVCDDNIMISKNISIFLFVFYTGQ